MKIRMLIVLTIITALPRPAVKPPDLSVGSIKLKKERMNDDNEGITRNRRNVKSCTRE